LACVAVAGLVGVHVVHEHDRLQNLRRRDRDHGRGRGWQWQLQDILVHQRLRQRRHLSVATANALPLAGVPIGPGGVVEWGEEGGGSVAGRGQAEKVIERGK